MSYYIKKQSLEALNLPLGSSFLSPNTDKGLIEQIIIIDPKKEYGYWAKKLLKALNTGLISQLVFDIIEKNENKERQLYTLSLDFEFSKESLLSVIDTFNFEFIKLDSKVVDMLKALNENGYQIIKNN